MSWHPTVHSVLVSAVMYGAMAGVISTLLMGLAAGDQEYAAKIQGVKAWMSARRLKKPGVPACVYVYTSFGNDVATRLDHVGNRPKQDPVISSSREQDWQKFQRSADVSSNCSC